MGDNRTPVLCLGSSWKSLGVSASSSVPNNHLQSLLPSHSPSSSPPSCDCSVEDRFLSIRTRPSTCHTHDTRPSLFLHESPLTIRDETRGAGRLRPRSQSPQAYIGHKFHRTCSPPPLCRYAAATGLYRRLSCDHSHTTHFILLLVHRNRVGPAG